MESALLPLCSLSALLQVLCRCDRADRGDTGTAQHWQHNKGWREGGERLRASFTFLRSSLCDLRKVCEEREYQSDSEGGDEPDSPERISSRGAQQEEKEEEVQDVLGISTVLPLSKKVCSAGSQRFVAVVSIYSTCFAKKPVFLKIIPVIVQGLKHLQKTGRKKLTQKNPTEGYHQVC